MNNNKNIFYKTKFYKIKIEENLNFKYLKKNSLISYTYLTFEKNKLKKLTIKGNVYKINKKFLILKFNTNITLKIPLNSPQINNIKLLK
uniref:50S ribosomal protein L19 n=1 Tax=Nephromyces sp. ex Molgula occidentalis TaxID=2544991 RepID=A0A5C1H7C5_9APIC|nr:hypothetical protein [Nephromyces sp. ex Molgula occidentalis]